MKKQISRSNSALDIDAETVNVINMDLQTFPFDLPQDSKVKYFYISGNQFLSLPENMPEIIFVDLSNNGMGPLPPIDIAKALASYPKLRTLYLSGNQLEGIQDFFKNSTVDSFNLAQNRFREFPEDFFERFPKLVTLSFDCNFLINFPNQKSESIVTLSMPLNCIQSIESTNTYFSQLTTLDLSKNQIKSIPKNFSKSFPKLSYLNLSDNLISEIPENDSENLVFPESLKILDLSNNFIEKFSNSITGITNLLILNIINNKITDIPQLQLKLKKFRASKNRIKSIQPQSLNLMRHFTLAHNELTTFPTDIKLKATETFKVNHNKITEINFNSINVNEILPKTITRFDISFNEIDHLPKEIFESLPNLENFCMHFNKIKNFPSEILNCRRLNYLNISYNPIKKLPKLPKFLESISASNCELEDLEDVFPEPEASYDSFNEVNYLVPIHLTNADFSGNKLVSFPVIPGIKILNLSQNRLKELPELTEKLKILDVSMNLIDSLPDSLSSDSLIDLILSHNKLTKVPVFEDVPKLRYLDLAGNPIEGVFGLTNLSSLERINIAETKVSLDQTKASSDQTKKSRLLEVITTANDDSVVTFSKSEDLTNSPILRRTCYINQRPNKSGLSEFLGLRSEMEDSIILRDDLNLYAICDGHSGPDTAKFASIRLTDLFEEKIKSFSHHMSVAEMKLIFKETEEDLKELEPPDGSTLCLAYIQKTAKNKRTITTAHLGDTRAIVVRVDGKVRELTKDHKTTIRSEFERIRNEFGKLTLDNRIDGILGVSRALGDFGINGVGREPEFNEFEIDDVNDKFLVIGCDGVFDVLTSELVAKIAYKAQSPNEAAFIIRNSAFGSDSTDNISVIVVDLSYK